MLAIALAVPAAVQAADARELLRYADDPRSWLVLYNAADPQSVEWANWYQTQRGIPSTHMMGLQADVNEHLADLATAQAQILTPVRNLLDARPDLRDAIMGIILGYGLPGTYGVPPFPGNPGPQHGGYSIADALQDMYDDHLPNAQQKGYNPDSPQLIWPDPPTLPPGGRLSRATMTPNRYMVARIDGPTLAAAEALTTRAKAIEDASRFLHDEHVWFDTHDPVFPTGSWWWMDQALIDPILNYTTPWSEFDADVDQTPNDAMRFGAIDITGWNDSRLRSPNPGSRVLAFNYNSFGATTLRSITDHGARYVPNALDAGYAAAIGATAEPLCCRGPVPETLLAALREGWTLGEAYYLANIHDDWMWTLVGDPFLRLPNWLDPPPKERTADRPDSWLVLYNLDVPGSVAWAEWYQTERSIPHEQLIGLHASSNEHLPTTLVAQREIIIPVRARLDADSRLESRIMGIILGPGLPGSFGTAPGGGPGGFSITDALMDMYDDQFTHSFQRQFNPDNPRFLPTPATLPSARLTKATMTARRYMTARIDGPTTLAATELTLRAKSIEDPALFPGDQFIWFEPQQWFWLTQARADPLLSALPAWQEFDAAADQTPNDAIRLGAHDLNGWNDDRLRAPASGARVLAFNYNRFGATTIRSTTAGGGRYVPNALDAGYAAAIGATGDAGCCLGPLPQNLLAALDQGWTLGESFYLAKLFDDWVWTLVGDPFLTLPNGLRPNPNPPPGDGDLNFDGAVNGLDLSIWTGVLTGQITTATVVRAADMDANGVVDEDDTFLLRGPLLFGTYDPQVLRGSGDADANGVVDGRDLAVFVRMLVDGTSGFPIRMSWPADMDRDGQVGPSDLPLFVDALLN